MYSNFQFNIVFQDWIVGKQFACNENWDSQKKYYRVPRSTLNIAFFTHLYEKKKRYKQCNGIMQTFLASGCNGCANRFGATIQFVNKSVKNISGDVSAELAAYERHPKIRRRENAFLARRDKNRAMGGEGK